MRLIEIISVIPDYQDVEVHYEDPNESRWTLLGVYNGKDSIPTFYNEAWVNRVYAKGNDIIIVVDLDR